MSKAEYMEPEPVDVERGALVRVVGGPFGGQLATFVEVTLTGWSKVEVDGEKLVRGKLEPCRTTVLVRKVDPNPVIVVE